MIAGGKSGQTPVALVESATLPEEKLAFTTLAALAAEAMPRASGPVVMCVGEVFSDRSSVAELLERCRTA